MNVRLLHALRRLAEDAMAEWLAESPGGGLTQPRVFVGAVPDDIGDEEAFPCIVLRTAGGDSEDAEDLHEFQFLAGVFGEQGPAAVEEAACAVSQRLLLALRGSRILESKWELVRPVRVTRRDPRDQDRRDRYDVVVITTRWRDPAPAEPLEV